MATKPTVPFTWSTDANFSSGAASGNPTKVDPAGWPTNLQGFVPGVAIVAEFVNKLFNNLGLWTGWLNSGSSTGAADAHIVETNGAGITTLTGATVTSQFQASGILVEDGVVTPATFGASQNNYNPAGLSDARTARVAATAGALNITGIAAPGIDGTCLRLINVGANAIGLPDENGSSTDINRILTPSGAPATLNVGGTAELWYDGTSARWRLLSCT